MMDGMGELLDRLLYFSFMTIARRWKNPTCNEEFANGYFLFGFRVVFHSVFMSLFPIDEWMHFPILFVIFNTE